MKRILFTIACLTASVLGRADTSPAVVGAGYTLPTPISVAPGQVITFFLHGIGAGLTKPVMASSLPLPTSLGGISATFDGQGNPIPVPIIGVEPVSPCSGQPNCSTYTAVTLQIPFNTLGLDPTVIMGNLPLPGQLTFAENGITVASAIVMPWSDQVHILRICGCDLNLLPGGRTGITPNGPAVTHVDGSRVGSSNPAKPGEEIVIYAVGLGRPEPFPANGDAPKVPIPIGGFRVSFDPRPNALASRPSTAGANGPGTATPDFVGLIPGYVGLYQINVKVPALPPGSERCIIGPLENGVLSNMTVNIFGHASIDGVGICVEPGS